MADKVAALKLKITKQKSAFSKVQQGSTLENPTTVLKFVDTSEIKSIESLQSWSSRVQAKIPETSENNSIET